MKILLVISGLLAATGAMAQFPADADGDGTVTRDEFLQARSEAAARQFERLDSDADGVLTADEAWRRPGRMQRGPDFRMQRGPDFASIDTDGDGAWSLPELQALRPELTVEQFNRLDANNDGLISEDERPKRRGRHGGPPRD